MKEKNRSFTFVRHLWDAYGEQIGEEKKIITCHPGKDPEKTAIRAFNALFKACPEWGKGLPMVNGRGWSSARLIYNP